MLRIIKGQSTLEYALIVAVVVAGLIAMQFYMKRGVQGKLRESIDSVGTQYSAGHVNSTYTTEQNGTLETKETFGLSSTDGTTFDQGVSYYNVTAAPTEVKRSATGADKETITKNLSTSSERLVPL